MENDKMIGLRIQKRRAELKLSFNQVCEMTHISTGNLSGIENAKYLPSSKALLELSRVLDCSIDWILTGENWNSEQNKVLISEQPLPTINGLPITPDELSLVENYRKLNPANKSSLKDFCNYKIYEQSHSQGLSSTSNHGKNNMEENSEIA